MTSPPMTIPMTLESPTTHHESVRSPGPVAGSAPPGTSAASDDTGASVPRGVGDQRVQDEHVERDGGDRPQGLSGEEEQVGHQVQAGQEDAEVDGREVPHPHAAGGEDLKRADREQEPAVGPGAPEDAVAGGEELGIAQRRDAADHVEDTQD